MKPLANRIRDWGSTLHLLVIILLIFALFTFWTYTLNAFSSLFFQVSGQPLLDLENRNSILSVDAAMNLIRSYNIEARKMYWSFFILDNAVPFVVFGSLSLLWVNILKRYNHSFAQNLLNSSFVLLPLGVGLFDIAENTCFVTAISSSGSQDVSSFISVGLVLVRMKALCLFSSFGVTLGIVLWHIGFSLRALFRKRAV